MKSSSIFTCTFLFVASALSAPTATRTTTSDSLSPKRWEDCPAKTTFYICSSNNFRGCCSIDPCALPSCPDTKPIPIFTNTTTAEPFSPTQTIYPSLQVLWTSKSTSLRSENTARGHLLTAPNEQVNTAVYFALGPEAVGKTCKLVFRLSNDDALVTSSSSTPAVFDLYRLKRCLNVGYSYINRVERGALAGILTAKKGKWDDRVPAAAEWQGVDMSEDETEPRMWAAPTWSCGPGEYSFEMVARPGVNVGWTSGRGSGLSIELCG